MPAPILAIDFGSSRIKVAWFCSEEGRSRLVELGEDIRSVVPSVFYIPPAGNVLVGDSAVQMADEDPAGIVVDIKRDIQRPGKIRSGEGRAAYQRWELASAMFCEIRRKCEQEVFHNAQITQCVLTVPVCFTEPQRQKLREAAELAGFTSVRMIEEPTAAAMHWLSSSGESISDHVIVVDIGGGGTDIAALKFNGASYEPIAGLASFGRVCGGSDVDEELMCAMADKAGGNGGALLFKLRTAKERLHHLGRDSICIHLAGKARYLSCKTVEEAIRNFVAKVSGEVDRFLKDFESAIGGVGAPVLLTGGGSKLAGMKDAIEGIAGSSRVSIWNDGEYAIALGAALVARPQQWNNVNKATHKNMIDCGIYRFDHGWNAASAKEAGWILGSESGSRGTYREQKIPIDFKIRFLDAPQVLTMISGIDVADSPLRLRVTAESVTSTGFVLTIGTWVDSEIYGICVQWIAIGI